MNISIKISGLAQLGLFINQFLEKTEEVYSEEEALFSAKLSRAEIENPWFTQDSLRFALKQWADLLTEENLNDWVNSYPETKGGKKVGLILAGNIPLVGFHDVITVVLSGHTPVIKMSSKDKQVLPFLLEKWASLSEGIEYQLVEKLENYDAVIATGSNNTARYLEYYFKNKPNIIRKNRTSVAVLSGKETNEELQLLAEDIFRYFGLGCRNVTRLFIPQDFKLERLFENFVGFQDIINHNKYANNYDYNRAVYLLNQENFWDNNFVMLKEDTQLFSPLSVINFSRYDTIAEVETFLNENHENIQCIVSHLRLNRGEVGFGEAQTPSLNTYADDVDTMAFLRTID
ncbi:acyl-CoA reductase [Riemerella anatipestifer]|uniref:Acyl-CoA reductase n=1 Tax=Riemerella anatipestifer (strain ATCC 11845 / DSM 15868 / JCM 9532 / NCTC 11014) TaxID=693978 RepID=E4TB91_RIEAD|nr:acyl-CoA reductase [Riemerella anatipestifer]ADQ81327.1 acyl-CoA reductase [Riemerella anatipestifer ATCC 11845 = DSM 15868]AFD55345.1 acyl-CoA reductase [Riemerella anatipestifer ATCC 11845 = DSM 15868]MRM91979.1 acyl-CoA reductase [Riemerella anatipestifer]MRN05660.1 acyl-CoA reductase [Riemerella anatipestifer]SNV52709.1 Acyl-CoA reductase (LuxC) [Riemerella anatipestifer]